MNLTNNDIKRILNEKPNKTVWEDADEQRKVLQMHLLGIGLVDYIGKIDGVEKQTLSQLRKKYAKSNRDLFARFLRPLDNIWDAKGGGIYYNTSTANSDKLKAMVVDVYNGFSLRSWIRNYIKPRYFDDPMGLIMMEVDPTNPNQTYPTYKSSADIYDAQLKGRSLEYLILKTSDPVIFRVIDDSFDRMVKKDDDKITFLNSKDYPVYINYFGKVPAKIISDIPKMGIDGLFESAVQNEIELAGEFLVDGSIRKLYKYRTGFPKEWRYPITCGTCTGTKTYKGNDCPDCNGTGYQKDSPDNTWIFQFPGKDGVGVDSPEISEKGGYVNPSLEYLQYADQDLDALEETIFETHWGTHQVGKSNDNAQPDTATARFIDVQPINNRLSLYASAFEDLETFASDHIGQINFNTSYKGTSISYGRRFIIEGPDELFKKYSEASKGAMPISSLDDLYMDYLEAKFQNQPLELERQVKLMKVEPFFHLSLTNAKVLVADITIYNKKLLFGEWVKTLNPIDINNKTVEQLRTLLDTFVNGIKMVIPDPNQPAGQPTKAAA
jgi:hypothetical protein